MTADEAASSAAGIPLRPFYAPGDGDYAGIGDPGTYPYTRGRMGPPAGRRRGWIHRELSGEGS
ncbi:MAG TPA: methylmalonyl-CoA mutase, partial [Streptosporangiaceae bacterium]|nr:methylmalonyl-CoA mutase [Streptosporangiaceae bacterium]